MKGLSSIDEGCSQNFNVFRIKNEGLRDPGARAPKRGRRVLGSGVGRRAGLLGAIGCLGAELDDSAELTD